MAQIALTDFRESKQGFKCNKSGSSWPVALFPHQIDASGLSCEINQLLIGEALSDQFDGKILNPYGVEIDLPFWVFKRLKKLRLLERDTVTGMRRIQARVFGLMDLWDGPPIPRLLLTKSIFPCVSWSACR